MRRGCFERRVASLQAIIVPCGVTAKTNKQELYDACEDLAKRLKKAGVRAKADVRDGYTPGYKFNDWEQKVFRFFSSTLIRLSYTVL